MAAAQEEWGNDDESEGHYDPVAEAQESWGDDTSQPVTEVPARDDETPADEPPAEAAEEEATPAPADAADAAAVVDDEEGQVTKETKKWRDASG